MSILEQKSRDLSRPFLEAVASALAKVNISPDGVTYAGLVLTFGVAALTALGKMQWAGLAYLFAGACDALDGTLARVSGKGSRFGAFLDSSIDRIEESIVFLGLVIYYTRAGATGWEIPTILVAAIASLMVSYTRARAEAVGVDCQVGFMTRPPRVGILILGLLLNQVFIAVVVIAAASVVTTIHRLVHVWRMTGGEKGGWSPPQQGYSPPEPTKTDPTD